MKSLILFIFSINFATAALADSVWLRCSGTERVHSRTQDLFFYNGETITMLSGGTEDMYVPFHALSGTDKVYQNTKYRIVISSKKTITIENKRIASKETFQNIRCVETGE